jgi:hypothetical protein
MNGCSYHRLQLSPRTVQVSQKRSQLLEIYRSDSQAITPQCFVKETATLYGLRKARWGLDTAVQHQTCSATFSVFS